MRCVTIYEAQTDLGTGSGSAVTFTINPYANIKSRQMPGTASLVGVSARFVATAGDGDTRQSTDTIITVSRTRTDTTDSSGTAFTDRGDWNTQMDIEDRTVATGSGPNAYDYDFVVSPGIPWSEDESLTVSFDADSITGAVLVSASTRWSFE